MNDGDYDYGVKIDFPIKVQLWIKQAQKSILQKDTDGIVQTKSSQSTEVLYVTLNKCNCT